MKKIILISLGVIIIASIGSVVADHGDDQPCSRNQLEYKYHKNLQNYQQEMPVCQQAMAACNQGYSQHCETAQQYCEKAEKDRQDVQRYLMQFKNCPYP
jgi:hypothetical protein